MRVLVVEDDPMIGRAMVAGLRQAGYAVDWTVDGVEGGLALDAGVHELALLDLGLPRRSGLDLLAALRAQGCSVPVVVITARDAVDDRVRGLDMGADDYLVKPFSLDELLARMRAVLRRREGRASRLTVCGALEFDPVRRTVRFRRAPVILSGREISVLETLIRDPGAVVSRERLEEAVYGWGEEIESNSIEVHVHHLRRKLDARLIRTIRGVGYQIVSID